MTAHARTSKGEDKKRNNGGEKRCCELPGQSRTYWCLEICAVICCMALERSHMNLRGREKMVRG